MQLRCEIINWNKIKCTSVKRNFYFKIKHSADFEIKISEEIVHFILFVVLIVFFLVIFQSSCEFTIKTLCLF